VDSFDPDAVRELLGGHGLEISALAYYPNNLHPDAAHREEVNAHLLKVVDAAQALGVGVALWDEMFDAIPSPNFGLNLDPSHLVWQMIDYERVVYDTPTGSSTSTPRTWRSTAKVCTATASFRSGSAGRFPGCPASARCAGIASSPPSTPLATTTSFRSNTRTARSRATISW
jgi:hypothetical protein